MLAQPLHLTLSWCNRNIDVRYVPHWLNTAYDHIELRCSERLPVTDTGYRSRFVQEGMIAGEVSLRVFIQYWLDVAADNPKWRAYLLESRQLKLF